MFDISEHKWSDRLICLLKGKGCFALTNDKQVVLATSQANWITINKDDAIAIAKHFNLLNESVDVSAFSKSVDQIITESILGNIPQSENTYKSLNLDSVGEIKDNELFNKESDSHD